MLFGGPYNIHRSIGMETNLEKVNWKIDGERTGVVPG